ncbi:hypothetical protein VTH82DRAFT_8268 [Thermothelomyces myriococcoides]
MTRNTTGDLSSIVGGMLANTTPAILHHRDHCNHAAYSNGYKPIVDTSLKAAKGSLLEGHIVVPLRMLSTEVSIKAPWNRDSPKRDGPVTAHLRPAFHESSELRSEHRYSVVS